MTATADPRDGAAGADSTWEPGFDGLTSVVPEAPGDSGFLSRQARRLVLSDDSAARRIVHTYAAARAALGVALIGTQLAAGSAGAAHSVALVTVIVAYAAQAIVWWLLPRFAGSTTQRLRRGQWWATIGVDIAAFGLMQWLDAASSLNYAALLVLPVLMAGLLSPRLTALATTSAVAMLLLATAWRAAFAGTDPTAALSQAGLAGIGLFVIALLSGEMASRLAREERTARGSLELARQQAQLNRLVIEEMADGVLVVDERGQVRTANPAAKALLALGGPCPPVPFALSTEPTWQALWAAVQEAFGRGRWPDAGIELTLQHPSGAARAVKVRARFTRRQRLPPEGVAQEGAAAPGSSQEVLGVLFMEDLSQVQTRLRQERLAAMGRVSAGIAHEIRNPLAAVAQANELLQDDSLRPDQQRLVRIVADNVQRLKRIVDDVMEAAPGSASHSQTIDATAEVSSICVEWARTAGVVLGPQGRLRMSLPNEPVGVVFDPDHLRRVLVNLLDNALRHSSQAPGAIKLSLKAAEGELARLAVASDGAPIAREVDAHLFEPFHSTRSRGTGLGLYICRELCARYGASIDYVRRDDPGLGNLFQVLLRRETLTIPR